MILCAVESSTRCLFYRTCSVAYNRITPANTAEGPLNRVGSGHQGLVLSTLDPAFLPAAPIAANPLEFLAALPQGIAAFLFAPRSGQTQSVLDTDLTQHLGKRIQFARALAANAGV